MPYKEKLYCYAFPHALEDHDFTEFTDDVAIVWAINKEEAIKKFKRLYSFANNDNVQEVKYCSNGVAILTMY